MSKSSAGTFRFVPLRIALALLAANSWIFAGQDGKPGKPAPPAAAIASPVSDAQSVVLLECKKGGYYPFLASTGFGLGANPDNMTFTTGLGINPVQFPLKADSLRTGQPPPAGLTVFGPSDQSQPDGMCDWVHQWVLAGRMIPGSRTWPPTETYVDINSWAGACEFDVNRPVASAAYVWCYLAARP